MFASILIIIIALTGTISARCGQPELPLLAVDLPVREYYEDGDEVQIQCLNGSPLDYENNDTSGVIKCVGNHWHGFNFRCLRVVNPDLARNAGEDNDNNSAIHNDIQSVLDKDIATCFSLDPGNDIELSFSVPTKILHVALIINNRDVIDNSSENIFDIEVLVSGQQCFPKEHTHGSNLPVSLLIYKCSGSHLATNVHIVLRENTSFSNLSRSICDIEAFSIQDNDCGKPEVPLFSTANVFQIQNQTKLVEYSCFNGYHSNANNVRICGTDGLWYPLQAPKCFPIITCKPLHTNHTKDGRFTIHYSKLDIEGHAIPGISYLNYECSNPNKILITPMVRNCLSSGTWAPLKSHSSCITDVHSNWLKDHFSKSEYFTVYTISGIFILPICIAVIILSLRRIGHVKKSHRQSYYSSNVQIIPRRYFEDYGAYNGLEGYEKEEEKPMGFLPPSERY